MSQLCRVCGEKTETVAHVAGSCGLLMKGPGTVRHDKVGARVHWELCRKYDVECSEKWFQHKPQSISKSRSGEVTIYWDYKWTMSRPVYHCKPDVVVRDSKTNIWTIIDFAVPLDHNIVDKEQEKITNYGEIAQVIRSDYRCKTKIVPIVVGAFGMVTKNLPTFLKQLGIPDVVGGLQTSAILGTQRLLKNVLSL